MSFGRFARACLRWVFLSGLSCPSWCCLSCSLRSSPLLLSLSPVLLASASRKTANLTAPIWGGRLVLHHFCLWEHSSHKGSWAICCRLLSGVSCFCDPVMSHDPMPRGNFGLFAVGFCLAYCCLVTPSSGASLLDQVMRLGNLGLYALGFCLVYWCRLIPYSGALREDSRLLSSSYLVLLSSEGVQDLSLGESSNA